MKIRDIRYCDQLFNIESPRDSFIVMNSSVTAMMGIRKNNDLDILVTENFGSENNIPNISINPWFRWKNRLASFAVNAPDFILKHSVKIDGFNICKPEIHLEILKTRVSQGSGGQKTVDDLKRVIEALSDIESSVP